MHEGSGLMGIDGQAYGKIAIAVSVGGKQQIRLNVRSGKGKWCC